MPVDFRDPAGDETFLRYARTQRVAPLIHTFLRSHPSYRDLFSPGICDALQQDYFMALAQGMEFERQLAALAASLSGKGIEAIAFKGVAAGLTLYGDSALRTGTDFDLLVREKDFGAAAELLQESGYAPERPLGRLRLPLANEHRNALMWYRSGAVPVHLYWHLNNLVPWRKDAWFDIEAAWEESLQFWVGGVPLRCLGPEDTLLYLCMHAFSHAFAPLILLCDIWQAARKVRDWDALAVKARRYGLQEQAFHALSVTGLLLGPAWPSMAFGLLRPVRVSRFERRLVARCLEGRDAEGLQMLSYWGMNKSLRDKLSYGRRLAFPHSHPAVAWSLAGRSGKLAAAAWQCARKLI